MKKKPSLFLLLFALISLNLSSQDQITLGREDQWRDSWTNNIILKRGWEGYWDLNVLGSVYETSESTDLLLPFDESRLFDETSHYMLEEQAVLTEYEYRRGRSSAVLREGSPLVIMPKGGSLFSGKKEWNDFTIEFQLYPALLQEGEILFHWKGLYQQSNELIPQEITCRVSRRQLVWTFKNFFISNDTRETSFTLRGDSLVPRKWNHHMIRYKEDQGLFEYLIDGIPADVSYTTPSEREESHIFLPQINQSKPTPITVGTDFTGFIDEFRISSEFIESPQLEDFKDRGVYLSPVVDLVYQNSTLISVESIDRTPGLSTIIYHYAFSDRKEEIEALRRNFSRGNYDFDSPLWQPLNRGEKLDNIRGRYLLIGAQLYPDLGAAESPVISELQINYQSELPPIPPLNIKASVEDSGVFLTWDYWKDEGMGGFLIYYGDRPGQYFGSGSPILVDSSKRNYTIEGLEPHKRWYFSIVALSDSEPAQYSDFSQEVSARP